MRFWIVFCVFFNHLVLLLPNRHDGVSQRIQLVATYSNALDEVSDGRLELLLWYAVIVTMVATVICRIIFTHLPTRGAAE